MKTLYSLSIFVLSVLFVNAQTPVYLNIGSHNENGFPDPNYSTTINYATYSAYVKQLADTVIARQAKWNFQSDYKFLLGCINHDPHSAATGGTNLIDWMNQSLYIETDPHCHEGLYNYADISKLHDSLGATGRTVVGGQDPYSSRWADMETGINGNFFPTYVWNPDILWGFASPGHGFNDETYGMWRPQDSVNFMADAPGNHLHYIGNGCSNVVFSGSTVTGVMDTLRMILNKIQNGTAPASGFYTATIMCNVRDFNSTFINKMAQIIDSVAPYVASGKVIWATLQEKNALWASTYGSNPFQWDCAQTVGIDQASNPSTFSVYPNPVNNVLTVELGNSSKVNSVAIYDMLGKEIKIVPVTNEKKLDLSTAELQNGIYLVQLRSENKITTQRVSVVH